MGLTTLDEADDGPDCTHCGNPSKLVVLGEDVVTGDEEQVIPLCVTGQCPVKYFAEMVPVSTVEEHGYDTDGDGRNE